MPDKDTLSPEDSAALVHAQQQLYAAGDPRASKLYNYIVQAGYATKGDNGELHPQGETKSFYDKNIKGTLSGTAGWQQAIDKAGHTEPIDTSSAGGFAKTAANDLGAGAVRVFSPLVHPLNTAGSVAKIAAGGASMNPQAMGEAFRPAVEQVVKNPSGEAVAAIPQAALALAGGGEAQPAANAIERSGAGGGVVANAADATQGLAGKYAPAFVDGPPETLLTKAVRPNKNNVKWNSDAQTAIPLMKSAEQALGKPVGGIDDALEAAKAAKQNVWQQVRARLGPAAAQGTVIDGNPIADAMMSSIDKRMALQNPGLTEQIKQAADIYRKPISVDDLENFIQSNNKELIGYYAKNKVSQAAAEADPVIAAKVAEGNAARAALYSKIDSLSGPGVAQLKQAYGALSNVQKELTGRQIVYARQAPVNLGEQMSYLQAGGKILTGNVLGGLKDIAIRRYLSDLNDSNSQISRAFAKASTAEPFPTPTWRAPQTINLLPSKSGGKIPALAPDPGMSIGEMRAAAMQEFRRRQQLALPAQATPIQLPSQF